MLQYQTYFDEDDNRVCPMNFLRHWLVLNKNIYQSLKKAELLGGRKMFWNEYIGVILCCIEFH